MVINNLLITFRRHIYISRDQYQVNFGGFISRINFKKNTEKALSIINSNKLVKYNRKCQIIDKNT